MALSKREVEDRLQSATGWKRDDDEIEKKFEFADFGAAMAFVNRVAEAAEAADHHPDISIKYNKVKMSLSTHSEGGVTEKDFNLAAQIDAAAGADTTA
ncbi:MAG TPA: 4a-hydroxytetrahydrobiopterin dehydratase [Dehalococcoidia bacterium]|jgi:4a-hydroxytetrahydrobiopterin dehydratase